MTIHLPSDLESSIQAAVLNGQFASVDDAMAEAARLLLRKLTTACSTHPVQGDELPDPFLGSMSDHAELMDQIVEDAMRHREHQPWRLKGYSENWWSPCPGAGKDRSRSNVPGRFDSSRF